MRIKFTKTLFCLFCSLFFLNSNAQVTFLETFSTSLGAMTPMNGSSANWIWSNSCGKSALTGHTTLGHALFSGSGCQFGNSFNTVSGDMVSPPIAVGALGAILTFNYALENECGNGGFSCFYDRLSMQISNNGGNSYTTIMDSNGQGLVNGTGWASKSYTLSAYAGQTILIRFNFNSIDGVGNTYDGVYIDDIKVEDILPCSGTPASNTVVPSTTLVCPGYGNSLLTLANGYSQGNIQYTWLTSTVSSVGTWTAVPGATTAVYPTSTLNATTWYQAVIKCTNSNQSYTTAAVQINVQSVTTNTAPYFEGFEGIQVNNQLPNCSWSATSPTTVCRTYTNTMSQNRTARTGTKFASFYYSPSGTNYFYTNGIYMYPGVTYSASMWYSTDSYGDLNWSDLSILLGTSQSTTGLIPVASTNGAASSQGYKPLSNLFTVQTAGYYYVAIRATTGGCCAQHLNWDDLAIEIPCVVNTPTINLSVSDTIICSGKTITLSATGADILTWNTGTVSDTIVEMPTTNTIYYVTGKSSITGCKQTVMSKPITVNPSPAMSIFANPQTVCRGKSALITALGANSYTWGGFTTNNNFITVTPTANTTYTVIGSNQYDCEVTLTQSINVAPSPTVSGQADRQTICKGEEVTLDGSGADSYQWTSPSLFVQSAQAVTYPIVTTQYTLTGTNAAGCSSMTTVQVVVEECVGIQGITTTQSGVRVFPNPNAGVFTVQLTNGSDKTVEITDISGRVVYKTNTAKDDVEVNLSTFSNGVYYVKVQSASSSDVIKILKQ